MTTQIQRIPGNFSLPLGWPKLETPDIETGLYAHWSAEDLTAGTNLTDWKDRVSARSLKPQLGLDSAGVAFGTIPVVAGSDGLPVVSLTATQRLLGSTFDIAVTDDTTFLTVFKTDPANVNGSRILSGGVGYRLLSPKAGSSATIQHANNAGAIQSEAILTGVPVNAWTAVAASFDIDKETIVRGDGGREVRSPLLAGAAQNTLLVGMNSGSTITPGTNYYGQIAAVLIWKRALSPLDLASAIMTHGVRFGLNP